MAVTHDHASEKQDSVGIQSSALADFSTTSTIHLHSTEHKPHTGLHTVHLQRCTHTHTHTCHIQKKPLSFWLCSTILGCWGKIKAHGGRVHQWSSTTWTLAVLYCWDMWCYASVCHTQPRLAQRRDKAINQIVGCGASRQDVLLRPNVPLGD